MPAINQISINLRICAGDEDIAAWYNMLKENDLSIHIWTRKLLEAYLASTKIDIGEVCLETNSLSDSGNVMMGVGSADKSGAKRFTIGSRIQLCIYSSRVILALKNLKRLGYPHTDVIKVLIRDNLKIGTSNRPPVADPLFCADDLFALDRHMLVESDMSGRGGIPKKAIVPAESGHNDKFPDSRKRPQSNRDHRNQTQNRDRQDASDRHEDRAQAPVSGAVPEKKNHQQVQSDPQQGKDRRVPQPVKDEPVKKAESQSQGTKKNPLLDMIS